MGRDRYEYDVLYVSGAEQRAALNRAGAEGWDLAFALRYEHDCLRTSPAPDYEARKDAEYVLYLKRRLRNRNDRRA